MDESESKNPSPAEFADLETRRNAFVGELVRNERRLYAYILSIVPHWNDADEIYQETILRLWKGFDRFEPGSNFAAWAIQTAHYQVLTWRKKVSRNKLVFGRETVDLIVDAQVQADPRREDERHKALLVCIEKLSETNRDLLRQCYAEDAKIKSIAERSNRKVDAVYKTLQRIRLALHKCINEQVASEGTK